MNENFKRPECYREGKGEYPLCTGDGSNLCKRCQLWEDYPDSPNEPAPVCYITRVDEIVPGMTVSFLRKQKNLYVPAAIKGKPNAYRMVEDFDTGEQTFIMVGSDGQTITDVKLEEKMSLERSQPRRFGDIITE